MFNLVLPNVFLFAIFGLFLDDYLLVVFGRDLSQIFLGVLLLESLWAILLGTPIYIPEDGKLSIAPTMAIIALCCRPAQQCIGFESCELHTPCRTIAVSRAIHAATSSDGCTSKVVGVLYTQHLFKCSSTILINYFNILCGNVEIVSKKCWMYIEMLN